MEVARRFLSWNFILSTSQNKQKMSKCFFSFTESKNWCYRSAFTKSGLRSTFTDLKDGTVMHYWVPNPETKKEAEFKPNLLLIHGQGANALWQWVDIICHVTPYFNVYMPDLMFFNDLFTTRPKRTESFQAECVMRVMEANSVRKLSLVGLSYDGFVRYSMAAQFKDVVERVVICCPGVCLEENDLKDGVERVVIYNFWVNYSKPTCGLAGFNIAYLWFKTFHFTHLGFKTLAVVTHLTQFRQKNRSTIKATFFQSIKNMF
ncbi:isoform 2 of monoacylglycerol lipase abhd6 [Fagus crenata]